MSSDYYYHQSHAGSSNSLLSWIPVILLSLIVILPGLAVLIRLSFILYNKIQQEGIYSLLHYLLNGGIEKIKTPPKVPDVCFPYGLAEYKGIRGYMEDRSLAISNVKRMNESSIYAVFDGHGGVFASQFCIDNIPHAIESFTPDMLANNTEKTLTDLFRMIDEQLLQAAAPKKINAGTTAVMLYVNGNKLTVANAGDSRAVLVQFNGVTKPLSDDHKPDRKDERDRITKLGGIIVHWGVWRVEGLLAVSRSLGDPSLKKFIVPDPEFVHHTIGKNDLYVVLATDGLWDVVRNDDVARILTSVDNSQTGAELLCQEAIKRGSTDNITVMVIDLQSKSSGSSSSSRPL